MNVALETNRLLLRPISVEDVGAIQRIASDARVALTTASIPYPYPANGAERFARAIIAGSEPAVRGSLALVVRAVGTVVGLIGYSIGGRKAEITWSIPIGGVTASPPRPSSGWRAKSWADEPVDAVLAHVMAGNAASLRVLEKAGFRRTGESDEELPVRGGTYRVLHWELSREERVTPAPRASP